MADDVTAAHESGDRSLGNTVIKSLALLVLVGLATCMASFSVRACQTPIEGITFTHYLIDSNAVCKNGRDIARVLAEGPIIPNYGDPQVRAQVQKDLSQAQEAGFGLIRTVLWFTQDKRMAPWGQLEAPLQKQDAEKIRQYGADIRAAGFRHWMVVFSPGVGNGPLCKKKTWGDCWDRSRTQANIDFVDSVYGSIGSLANKNFEIEYDLSGELCPSRYFLPAVDRNIRDYVTQLIKNVHTLAPSAPIHISCGGLGDDRPTRMLQIFKAAGISPNEIDIHFYDVNIDDIEKKLVPAAALAQENHIPLAIGEMQYENPEQASAIGKLAKQHNICFSELIQWPRTGVSLCQINVNPPFSNRLIRHDLLGQTQ